MSEVDQERNRLIIFEHSAVQTKAALFEGDKLVELYLESQDYQSLVGNIYRGKVKRVVPQMQSLFVDIGLSEPGLLASRDIAGFASNKPTNLSEQFHEGQVVWVQVKKDERTGHEGIEGKGVRLSTDINIESPNIILLPYSSDVYVSKRITDPHLREAFHQAAKDVVEKLDYSGGLIVRSSVAESHDETWLKDLQPLIYKWTQIKQLIQEKTKVGLVYDMGNVLETLKNQCEFLQLDSIEGVKEASSVFSDSYCNYQQLERKQLDSLSQQLALKDQINQAMQSLLTLANGGSIVIEETEALVAIDVNLGSALQQGSSNLDVNLQAAELIVRQIRLRNLAGIIVVDFIRMNSKKNRQILIKNITEQFAGDSVEVKLFGFTRLGLFEISRQRIRPSLASILSSNGSLAIESE